MIQKSTIAGAIAAIPALYMGYKELQVPPLHSGHAAGLGAWLLLCLALILNDDARILGFLEGLGKIVLPWKRPPAP